MASITWTCVFGILIFELVVTFILVVPVPRRIRNMIARKCIFKFDLGERFSKVIWFVAAALFFGLVESYYTCERLMQKLEGMEQEDTIRMDHHSHHHHHDKQRLYKAERNMYLSGFALTLLFVIGRILQLMQESVELEQERDMLRGTSDGTDTAGTSEGVEMTEVSSKPKKPMEKKKD